MIVDLLDGPAWLPVLALVVVVVVGPILGTWSVGRPRRAWWLAGAAWMSVAALTLTPDHRRLDARCTFQWSLPGLGRVEPMANVVLFVAPVLLVGVALRRPLLALVAGTTSSMGIEAVQAIVPGLGRSCDSNDWLSNTIGAVIGACLAAVVVRRHSAGDRSGPLRQRLLRH